jgi:cytochrome c-type biogenesis protein CcmH
MSAGAVRAATLRRWAPWLLIGVVLVVALAIGVQRNSSPSLDQRVEHLAGLYRCPSCDGETAAESNTATSVEIRNLIRSDLQAGQSAGDIRSQLLADYGPSILESPETHGFTLLVWVIPVIAVAGAVLGLGLAFRRWKRRLSTPAGPSDDDRLLVNDALAQPAPPAPEVPG